MRSIRVVEISTIVPHPTTEHTFDPEHSFGGRIRVGRSDRDHRTLVRIEHSFERGRE